MLSHSQTRLLFLYEKKLFWTESSFSKEKFFMWSLYGDNLPLCRNQQKNVKSNLLTYWHIMIIAQTVRQKVNIKRLKIYENFKNTARLILYYFTSCKCIIVWWDSYINTHERIRCNFQGQNIRNVWRACKARHHYDVTNKCFVPTGNRTSRWVNCAIPTAKLLIH